MELLNTHTVVNSRSATQSDCSSLSLSPVWLTSWSTKEHIWENHSFLNKMFAWEWLYIPQSRNGAELVNPGTLCDGGVLRAQHSPPRGRLLFFPVMSISLGISASLHTTCWAQQCGEARASGVMVSACQSQSQGSVSSHQSKKLYPDVTCLPLHLPPLEDGIPCGSLIDEISLSSKLAYSFFTAGSHGRRTTSFLSMWPTKMSRCYHLWRKCNWQTLSLHHDSLLFTSSIIC